MMSKANLMLVVVMLWTGSLPVVVSQHQPNTMRKLLGKSVCEEYDLPENAIWLQSVNCEENKFICKPGYELQVQTTCNNNGIWYLEPSCQEQSADGCLSGEKIENSDDVTPSGIYGKDYDFDCLTGFTKNGLKGTLTCGEDGNWTIKTPCEECKKFKNKISNNTGIKNYLYLEEKIYADSVEECKELCKNNITGCTTASKESDECLFYITPIIYKQDVSEEQCLAKCLEINECLTLSIWNEAFFTNCFLFNVTLDQLPEDFKFYDNNELNTVAEKVCE